MRRKFYEAKDHKPKITGWFLRQIQNLYHIESQLRQRRVGPAERERVRISQSLPIYRRLGKALLRIRTKRKILPQSNLGKAIDYAMGQWSKLERCFKDGRLEIDTGCGMSNQNPHGIRPTKLGAKNCRHSVMAARDAAASPGGCSSIAARSGERWLFMGSESAGQTNAT